MAVLVARCLCDMTSSWYTTSVHNNRRVTVTCLTYVYSNEQPRTMYASFIHQLT